MTGFYWLLILFGPAAVIVAANWWLGLWSNLVTLVNLVLAGLIATSFHRNVSNWMLNVDFTWQLIADFVSLWLLFALSFIILRSLTESFSRYRLRFDPMVEMVGRSLGSLAVGVFYVVFASYSLLIAPLPPNDINAFGEKGVYPESAWGGAVDYMSRNSLSAHRTSAWFGDVPENVAGEFRPAGSVNDFKTFGDELRKRIDRSPNLRLPKGARN